MSLQESFIKYCKANGLNPEGQYAEDDVRPAFAAGYRAAEHSAPLGLGAICWVKPSEDTVLARQLNDVQKALGKHHRPGISLGENVMALVKAVDITQHKRGWDDALESVARALGAEHNGSTLQAVRDLVARNAGLRDRVAKYAVDRAKIRGILSAEVD